MPQAGSDLPQPPPIQHGRIFVGVSDSLRTGDAIRDPGAIPSPGAFDVTLKLGGRRHASTAFWVGAVRFPTTTRVTDEGAAGVLVSSISLKGLTVGVCPEIVVVRTHDVRVFARIGGAFIRAHGTQVDQRFTTATSPSPSFSQSVPQIEYNLYLVTGAGVEVLVKRLGINVGADYVRSVIPASVTAFDLGPFVRPYVGVGVAF